MQGSAGRDDFHVPELTSREMQKVLRLEIPSSVVGYADSASSRIDSFRLTSQRSLEDICFNRPEEPVRVGEDNLRQCLSSMLAKIQGRPRHSSPRFLWEGI